MMRKSIILGQGQLLILAGLACQLLTGCQQNGKEDAGLDSKFVRGIEPQLREFFKKKENQARTLSELEKQEGVAEKFGVSRERQVATEVWPFFEAGRNGNWEEMTRLYWSMAERSYHFADNTSKPVDECLTTTVWQPINECFRTYEQLAAADPAYILLLGQEILDSMPAGSVFLAGSDAGRFITTFLSKSHPEGDPVFIVSQTGQADLVNKQYVEWMYGNQIRIPSNTNVQQVFSDYLGAARRRLESSSLIPGEDVQLVDGNIQVTGPLPVHAINAEIARVLFDHNPEREFYMDRPIGMPYNPLDWTYPHLEPNGFILKINREPLPRLDEEVVLRDREFWDGWLAQTLGGWLDQQTPIRDICEFADRVWSQKELSYFDGDPMFIATLTASRPVNHHRTACAVFSWQRACIADLYLWHARRADVTSERDRMTSEADYAFRQAFALCPYQKDMVAAFAGYLASQGRFNEAILVVESARKFYDEASAWREWADCTIDWLKKSGKSE